VDVAALTLFLAPFLGALLKGAQSAVEAAAEGGVTAAFEHAHGLWERLRGSVAERPETEAAARKLAGRPGSARRQRALGEQLELLLGEKPQLEEELGVLWGRAQAAGVVAVAAGDRSAAVAGSVSDSVIITGDNASVDR
jgi:hypothetical protein